MAVCALYWASYVNAGRRDGRKLDPSLYREIRYEELVGKSEEQLENLCEFLGLPYSPSMAMYYEGKMRPKPGKSAKAAWLPPTQGLRDWRTSLSDRDVELFEVLAGELLSDVGYERAVDTPGTEIVRVARRCSSWWANYKVPQHGAPIGRTTSPDVAAEPVSSRA